MRAEVIDFYKPEVVALEEIWLKGEEEIAVEGYRCMVWYRRSLHIGVSEGSGGVERFVKRCWREV